MEQLAAERSQLIDTMRRDRRRIPEMVATPGSTGPAPPAAAGPTAPSPSPSPAPTSPPPGSGVSAQVLLVGLGAFLLVAAGVIFAAVTWERLGAGGQAAVLVAATATATGASLWAARSQLTATAEALSVVAAGFALLDVHAVRIALAPGGSWQIAWSVGLVVLGALLVVFGKVAGLRGPAVVAALAAQLPLVFLATLTDHASVAVAAALIITAALDLAAERLLDGGSPDWFPSPVPTVLRLAGPTAWTIGLFGAAVNAFGDDPFDVTRAERWWGVALLFVAAVVATVGAWTGRSSDPLAVLASAGAVFATLMGGFAIGDVAIDDDDLIVLLVNALPVVLLAASIPWYGSGRDPRLLAGRLTATAWAAISWLTWVEPVAASITAPFVRLDTHGWWNRGLGVSTGDLDLATVDTPSIVDGPSLGLVLAAIAIGALALGCAAVVLSPAGVPTRQWGPAAAAGVGAFAAVAAVGARRDVPVILLVLIYLVAALALALWAAWPDERSRPWVVVGALPLAASALAWASVVDVYTVMALGLVSFAAVATVALNVAESRSTPASAATVVAGLGVVATALTTALASGASDVAAWIVAVAVAASTSLAAWAGDRWARWWTPVVELTALTTTAFTLLGLAAVVDDADPFCIGLGIVIVTAAAHVARPSRRVIATVIAACLALVLLWLQLWDGDVRAAEAYSLPAAALLGAAGWWQLRRDPDLGSWPTLGPALVVAAVPSVIVAIGEDGVLRPLLVLAAAVAVTLWGARSRLRAPLAVGAVTVVVITLDLLLPVASRLPRWVGLAAAGILLLVVGATFERQRRRVIDALDRYSDLR